MVACIQSARKVRLQIGNCEVFLIAPVTCPLLALGKMIRSGWSIQQHDGAAYLTNEHTSIPLNFRRNSLQTEAQICMLWEDDAEQQQDIRLVKFHGDSNLMKFIDDNLHDAWTQLDENCFALLSIGEQFVDSLGELGSDEAVYQTTIAWINDRWELIEFGTKIGNAEVREKIQNATPTTLFLTLVYKERCAPEQLGFEYLHEDAVSREFFGTGDALAQGRGEQKSVSSSSSGHVVAAPEISVLPASSASNVADTAGLDASMNEAEEESRQQELQVSGEAQNQDSAGAPVIVSDGGKDEKEEEDADVVISVNGVDLRATRSLKDLREACRHYEIGTSGGKAVVFKRLVRHQKKMSQPAVVPAAENAGDSLSAPSAPKTLPVPKEPCG